MVYLLCFHKHFKHAKHYIGFVDGADRLDKRMEKHRSGQGAKLIKAILKDGNDFVVARTWPDADRNFERKLKNRKKSSRLCPLCKAKPVVFKQLTVDLETGGLDGKIEPIVNVENILDSYLQALHANGGPNGPDTEK